MREMYAHIMIAPTQLHYYTRDYCVSSNNVDAWVGRFELGHRLLIPVCGVDYQ